MFCTLLELDVQQLLSIAVRSLVSKGLCKCSTVVPVIIAAEVVNAAELVLRHRPDSQHLCRQSSIKLSTSAVLQMGASANMNSRQAKRTSLRAWPATVTWNDTCGES